MIKQLKKIWQCFWIAMYVSGKKLAEPSVDHKPLSNLQKAKQSKLPYSSQAQLILSNFKGEFPFAEFEKWVEQNVFIVGGGNIIEFLEQRSQKAQNVIEEKIKNLTGINV